MFFLETSRRFSCFNHTKYEQDWCTSLERWYCEVLWSRSIDIYDIPMVARLLKYIWTHLLFITRRKSSLSTRYIVSRARLIKQIIIGCDYFGRGYETEIKLVHQTLIFHDIYYGTRIATKIDLIVKSILVKSIWFVLFFFLTLWWVG